jgi:hypothetical protein
MWRGIVPLLDEPAQRIRPKIGLRIGCEHPQAWGTGGSAGASCRAAQAGLRCGVGDGHGHTGPGSSTTRACRLPVALRVAVPPWPRCRRALRRDRSGGSGCAARSAAPRLLRRPRDGRSRIRLPGGAAGSLASPGAGCGASPTQISGKPRGGGAKLFSIDGPVIRCRGSVWSSQLFGSAQTAWSDCATPRLRLAWATSWATSVWPWPKTRRPPRPKRNRRCAARR